LVGPIGGTRPDDERARAHHQADSRPGCVEEGPAWLCGPIKVRVRSDKEGAAANFKGGYGFHPLLAYGDETGEALAAELRAGNAGANTAAGQITVAEHALEQIPAEHIETIGLLLRLDSAGATHELLDWCREGRIRFSVGYDLTDAVRSAILQTPDSAWISAQGQDGRQRTNGQVCEIRVSSRLGGTRPSPAG
jgi:hypothetical protein